MVVYHKLPLSAHVAAAHQRDWNPSPAADDLSHCRRLHLPPRQDEGVIDHVPRAMITLVSTTQLLPLTRSIALSQVRGSVIVVTDAVGLRALISSRADLSLLVHLLPLVCLTCRRRLYTSVLLWFTSVMCPTSLVAKNGRRGDPILPDPTTSTNDDRSLRWTNRLNPFESRSWQE